MATVNINNGTFLEKLASTKDGDFKKIVDKALTAPEMFNNQSYATQVMDTKVAMDFYEDLNREIAHDHA